MALLRDDSRCAAAREPVIRCIGDYRTQREQSHESNPLTRGRRACGRDGTRSRSPNLISCREHLDCAERETLPIVFQQSAVAKRHLGDVDEANALADRAIELAKQGSGTDAPWRCAGDSRHCWRVRSGDHALRDCGASGGICSVQGSESQTRLRENIEQSGAVVFRRASIQGCAPSVGRGRSTRYRVGCRLDSRALSNPPGRNRSAWRETQEGLDALARCPGDRSTHARHASFISRQSSNSSSCRSSKAT